jgi:hypothetical protein
MQPAEPIGASLQAPSVGMEFTCNFTAISLQFHCDERSSALEISVAVELTAWGQRDCAAQCIENSGTVELTQR